MKKRIKKTMLGIFAAGMVLFIGTAMAFAGSHRGGGHHRNIGSVCAEENFCQNINGKRFMDTNNDGICDNCDTVSRDCLCGRENNGQNYTDTDNDGICDNCHVASRNCLCGRENNGQNYTDTDNDGICDNCNTDSRDCRCGRGSNGQNYTDVDNDGICDNRTVKKSSGGRRGFCGRNKK